MNVQPIYNSKILKKSLEFAANNSSLFISTLSLGLSTVARPAVIMLTPKTDKENRKIACVKSLASSAVGYGVMLTASLPLSKAVNNIDRNPQKYLKQSTIKTLKAGEKILKQSKKYAFATQLFKLGLGFVIAVPKSILTCALIPPIMSKVFPKDKDVSFTGGQSCINKLSKKIGKIMDTNCVQTLADKFCNTNYEQHIISLTDILSTAAFIHQTSKSKQIEKTEKPALIYNAGISTAFCIAGGYLLNNITGKSAQRFIDNFANANKNSPKLDKYIEGIRVARPALILGGLYYILIPLVSTFLADRFDRRKDHDSSKNSKIAS